MTGFTGEASALSPLIPGVTVPQEVLYTAITGLVAAVIALAKYVRVLQKQLDESRKEYIASLEKVVDETRKANEKLGEEEP